MNVFNPLGNRDTLREHFTVKVKTAEGWQGQNIARLHISVGQEYHEGEKFAAAMNWARDNFDQVIVCVNDTLQRHNLVFEGKDPKEALRISQDRGKAWIARNITSEMRVDPIVKINQWDDWRHLDDYRDTLAHVNEVYRGDEAIQSAIQAEADSFWVRVKDRKGFKTDLKKPDFVKHSVAYLKEECAVFSMMFNRAQAADVYPGSTLIPCQLFKPEKLTSRGFTRIEFRPVRASEEGFVPQVRTSSEVLRDGSNDSRLPAFDKVN